MSKYSFNEISLKQFIFIIFETQVGVGVLSLPGDLAKTAGTDGWISIILGWILANLLSLVIIKIMEKNPGYTLFEILTNYFGKWVGKGLSVLWILYAMYIASIALFSAIHIITIWILPRTLNFILIILFIIPNYLILKHGIKVIGIVSELVFITVLWIPLLLLYALKDAEWLYLLPIGKEGILPILSTAKSTLLSFLGFEMAFLLYPFLKDKKSASKGIIIANSLSMSIFLMVTIVSFVKFAPEEITDYLYPTLNLMKAIQLPVIERLEILFLPFYLFMPFMTIVPYLYMSVFGASHLLGKQDHRNLLLIALFFWIAVSFFFIPSSDQITQLNKGVSMIGICFTFVFPILFGIYGWLYHSFRKERKHEKV
ncbi:endospore germination permease [Paenibacillus sp. SYP-B3998]|uniref:Endospore germination permease n=1 Tax=Paenibacillus sp. SYP-B3998 TaxID=2678564 RepID=A0A6G4A070_9BACL|nr:endospore germination permease [Paenibacillus sp. SYP-B3998]NEW07221.1 endospore germination permease [Paenibacillus sp. SYP-B3998]